MKPEILEILILHHTHTDIGYTHPQPVVWELQRRIIDSAIDLCEASAGRPEPSRMRWTCETSWPVVHWLDHASAKQIERFRRLVANGQLAIGALPLHLAPMVNAAQLAHGMQALGRLRSELGAPIKVAVSNDVNGLPWPIIGLLRDCGVEGLLMGINIHSGGFPFQRPRVFRWQGADGRCLPVYNSMQYNTFGRVSRYVDGSTVIMQENLDPFLDQLRRDGHADDFVLLTSSFPQTSDNFPPDPRLAEMVHRWNTEGRTPVLRFATPDMVLDRMLRQQNPPVMRGDWSDYWNFGAASSANESRVNRESANRLLAAQMLQAGAENVAVETRARTDEAYFNLNLFDEHTWGSDRTVSSRNCDPLDEQWMLNAAYAWRARSLSGMLLRDELERIAGNPSYGQGVKAVLCFNPAPVARECHVRVPRTWLDASYDHCCSSMLRLDADRCFWDDGDSVVTGPIKLPACGCRVIPVTKLKPAPVSDLVKSGRGVIESPFHRLRFDPLSGQITSLWDKQLRREFVDPTADWPFFGFVRETPDPRHHRLDSEELGRDAYFDTNWTRIHADEDCWNHDWQAHREGPNKLLACRTVIEPDGVTLVLEWDAPGVIDAPDQSNFTSTGFFAQAKPWLTQRIKLLAHRPAIEMSATFTKSDVRHAEALYFAFPLKLNKWTAHYDAAGVPVQWDLEQLDGSCKNWVTAGRWVSVHNKNAGVTLACPDAPLVQIGDFGFGRPQGFARGRKQPLLLAWVANNYWVTNFRASQPGPMRFRYELATHGAFDPLASTHLGVAAGQAVEVHPVIGKSSPAQRQFIQVRGRGVVPLQLKPASDGRDVMVMLLNVTDHPVTAQIRLPGQALRAAWRSNALEEHLGKLECLGDACAVTMRQRQITILRVSRSAMP